jgi:hypothetical protein
MNLHVMVPPEGKVSGKIFSVSVQRLAPTVAEQLALSLANRKIQGALRYQTIPGPITYLFNQRFMEETLERELSRVHRKGTPMWSCRRGCPAERPEQPNKRLGVHRRRSLPLWRGGVHSNPAGDVSGGHRPAGRGTRVFGA